MSGDIEYGHCDVCHTQKPLRRTYFRYDIKCDCHSPYHFELIRHCNECEATEPLETTFLFLGSKIAISTNDLTKIK